MTASYHKTVLSSLLVTMVAGCLLAAPGNVAPVRAGDLRLGAAEVKITPPIGIPMAGYYSRRDSEGVLDDLYAKAAVFDDGRTKVAVVVCDLIGLPRLIHATQFRDRSTGHGLKGNSAEPCARSQRLLHCQSSALATKPARRAFASTIQHVVHHACFGRSGGSWHHGILPRLPGSANISDVPCPYWSAGAGAAILPKEVHHEVQSRSPPH